MIDFAAHRALFVLTGIRLESIGEIMVSELANASFVIELVNDRWSIPLRFVVVKTPRPMFRHRPDAAFWQEMKETFPSIRWRHESEFELRSVTDCVLFRLLLADEEPADCR